MRCRLTPRQTCRGCGRDKEIRKILIRLKAGRKSLAEINSVFGMKRWKDGETLFETSRRFTLAAIAGVAKLVDAAKTFWLG